MLRRKVIFVDFFRVKCFMWGGKCDYFFI